MTDDDPTSATGGPAAPRMPVPPRVDEPRGVLAKLLVAVVDAGSEALIPIAIFLGLVGLMLL